MARRFELGDNFAAIGLAFEDDDELAILIERTLTGGRSIYTDTGRYVVASDGNGAELWFVLDKADDLISAEPYFRGKGAVPTKLTRPVHDRSDLGMTVTAHGWVNPTGDTADAGTLYPYLVDVLDWALIADRPLPFNTLLGVTAFPWELAIYETEVEFSEAARDGEMPQVAENFLSLGLLQAEQNEGAPPLAEAWLAGKVLESAVLRNPWGQGAYGWALVRIAGGQIDLMLDISQGLIPPRPGEIVELQAWLTACLAEQET